MNSPAQHNSADEDALVVSRQIRIPRSEFRFTFARSGGPGGQNVNKVSSKARLYWQVAETPNLTDDVKERFLQKFRRRISTGGELQVVSERYRDQPRNVADCLEKLREMLISVAEPPKRRRPTRPSRASKERRLEQKRQQSSRKQRRRPPRLDES